MTAAPAPMPIPLPEGMEAVQDEDVATAAPVGPLPYNFKLNAETGHYDKYDYSHTDVAKDWRAPSMKVATVIERPKPDNLFDHIGATLLSAQPTDLLNPPPLSKEEKNRKAAAAKAERDRRAGLGDEARAEEDDKIKGEKWLARRDLARCALAVRMGRKAFNYGTGSKTLMGPRPWEPTHGTALTGPVIILL